MTLDVMMRKCCYSNVLSSGDQNAMIYKPWCRWNAVFHQYILIWNRIFLIHFKVLNTEQMVSPKWCVFDVSHITKNSSFNDAYLMYNTSPQNLFKGYNWQKPLWFDQSPADQEDPPSFNPHKCQLSWVLSLNCGGTSISVLLRAHKPDQKIRESFKTLTVEKSMYKSWLTRAWVSFAFMGTIPPN